MRKSGFIRLGSSLPSRRAQNNLIWKCSLFLPRRSDHPLSFQLGTVTHFAPGTLLYPVAMLPQSEAGRLATYTGARLLWRWCIFGLLPGLCFGGAVAPTGSPAVAPSESPAIAPSGSPALAPTAVPAPTPLPTTFTCTQCAYPDECRALSALYSGTYRPENILYNWDSKCPESGWLSDITVDNDHVTGIPDWANNQDNQLLSGTVPTQIGYLTEITGGYYQEYLYFWGTEDSNSLWGTVPTEFGRLTRLSALEMGTNALTQTLPTELGQLTDLTTFDFDGNSLDCGIPTELSALGYDAYENPDSFEALAGASTCDTVNALSALYNEMFTSQDGSWGNWLANGYNNPCSTEPDAWSNQDSNDQGLFACSFVGSSTGGYYNEVVQIGTSNLQSGSLPTELGGLTALSELEIGQLALTATLPTELGRLTAITLLELPGV